MLEDERKKWRNSFEITGVTSLRVAHLIDEYQNDINNNNRENAFLMDELCEYIIYLKEYNIKLQNDYNKLLLDRTEDDL
jgi:hypothetical protein